MNKIALSTDKKIASFQPGNTWYNIYTTLEKDNVAVLGGRVGSVGVGGLTLGGGKTVLEMNGTK
jgi:FAD/FMN-containing dehydrogenase